MHLYGKNIQNFKRLLLWSHWANFAQISYGASLGWGNERLLKWSWFIDQAGRHAACLQWLCHSGERTVAQGPLVIFVILTRVISPNKPALGITFEPASVAQLDVPSNWRPGSSGFNPRRGRQHSFVEIDREIFSLVFLSLLLIQEGQLSVSGKIMCTILVNHLED